SDWSVVMVVQKRRGSISAEAGRNGSPEGADPVARLTPIGRSDRCAPGCPKACADMAGSYSALNRRRCPRWLGLRTSDDSPFRSESAPGFERRAKPSSICAVATTDGRADPMTRPEAACDRRKL